MKLLYVLLTYFLIIIKVLYAFENKLIENSDIVNIDPVAQEILVKLAEERCNATFKKTESTTSCPPMWDKVMCWPETPANRTVFLSCPDYINKFNKKNTASKICYFNETLNRAVWLKTRLSTCFPPKDADWSSVEKHYKFMSYIRIVGYITSMLSLVFSIIIMLGIKRLRYPRNYVHINLFVAFAIRTILTVITGEIIDKTKFKPLNSVKIDDIDLRKSALCRFTVFLFRYAGSVYQVAIFSEALYLVLLLKFPFYSEKRGFRFCILISWLLPSLWLIPWVITRITVKIQSDNVWCWQAESKLNLITKIPHTILLMANVICAVYIIRVLYTKLETKVSREKLLKYRRLAKSILILIPIFGLHFVLFAWSSYVQMNINATIVFNYIETFFNAFQGFVASVACCFIQRDVRIEALIFLCKCFKSASCYAKFPYCTCFNPDYITILRQKYRDNRSTITSFSQRVSTTNDRHRSIGQLSEVDDEYSFNSSSRGASLIVNSELPSNVSTSTIPLALPTRNSFKSKKPVNSKKNTKIELAQKDSLSSLPSINDMTKNKCFTSVCYECLFDASRRNDFHQTSHRHKYSLYKKRNSIRNDNNGKPLMNGTVNSNANTNKTNQNPNFLTVDSNNNFSRSASNSSSEISANTGKESRRLFSFNRKNKVKDNLNDSSNLIDKEDLLATTAAKTGLSPISASATICNECKSSKMVHFNETKLEAIEAKAKSEDNITSENKINKKSNIKNNNHKAPEINIIVNAFDNVPSVFTTWPLLESIDTFIDDDVEDVVG